MDAWYPDRDRDSWTAQFNGAGIPWHRVSILLWVPGFIPCIDTLHRDIDRVTAARAARTYHQGLLLVCSGCYWCILVHTNTGGEPYHTLHCWKECKPESTHRDL